MARSKSSDMLDTKPLTQTSKRCKSCPAAPYSLLSSTSTIRAQSPPRRSRRLETARLKMTETITTLRDDQRINVSVTTVKSRRKKTSSTSGSGETKRSRKTVKLAASQTTDFEFANNFGPNSHPKNSNAFNPHHFSMFASVPPNSFMAGAGTSPFSFGQANGFSTVPPTFQPMNFCPAFNFGQHPSSTFGVSKQCSFGQQAFLNPEPQHTPVFEFNCRPTFFSPFPTMNTQASNSTFIPNIHQTSQFDAPNQPNIFGFGQTSHFEAPKQPNIFGFGQKSQFEAPNQPNIFGFGQTSQFEALNQPNIFGFGQTSQFEAPKQPNIFGFGQPTDSSSSTTTNSTTGGFLFEPKKSQDANAGFFGANKPSGQYFNPSSLFCSPAPETINSPVGSGGFPSRGFSVRTAFDGAQTFSPFFQSPTSRTESAGVGFGFGFGASPTLKAQSNEKQTPLADNASVGPGIELPKGSLPKTPNKQPNYQRPSCHFGPTSGPQFRVPNSETINKPPLGCSFATPASSVRTAFDGAQTFSPFFQSPTSRTESAGVGFGFAFGAKPTSKAQSNEKQTPLADNASVGPGIELPKGSPLTETPNEQPNYQRPSCQFGPTSGPQFRVPNSETINKPSFRSGGFSMPGPRFPTPVSCVRTAFDSPIFQSPTSRTGSACVGFGVGRTSKAQNNESKDPLAENASVSSDIELASGSLTEHQIL